MLGWSLKQLRLHIGPGARKDGNTPADFHTRFGKYSSSCPVESMWTKSHHPWWISACLSEFFCEQDCCDCSSQKLNIFLGGSASYLQNRSNLRVVTGYKSAEISVVFSHRSLLLHRSWGSWDRKTMRLSRRDTCWGGDRRGGVPLEKWHEPLRLPV